ncbi:MAG: prolyl oligopeptidase family serine peptidase [Bacteroidales bacterium]|nr:prolyl oligopeptidase family serine peptidase [Bacteroidales bacterium]
MIENFDSSPEYEALRETLISNSIYAWPTNIPILLVHGTADDNVPPFESESTYNSFIQQGVAPEKIKLVMLEGKNHSSAIFPWGIETLILV